jgi:cytochrome P450
MEAAQDLVLGGLAVPRGMLLFFPTRPAMQDPALFGDPAAYRPERWQARGAEAASGCPHAPRAHVQFGAGPRVCPGRFLAGAEMRLVLSTLLRDFRLELACAPGEVQELMAFTMLPDRMPVRLLPR